MNAIFLAATMLALGMQDVETTPQTKTQLYVKTVPDGAEITLDGKVLGKSDGLYDVTSGAHRLTLRLEGYVPEERLIDAKDGEITRVEVRLKQRSGKQQVLGYVGDSQTGAKLRRQRPCRGVPAARRDEVARRREAVRRSLRLPEPARGELSRLSARSESKGFGARRRSVSQDRAGQPSLVHHRRAARRGAREVLRGRMVQRRADEGLLHGQGEYATRQRTPTPVCPTRAFGRSINPTSG